MDKANFIFRASVVLLFAGFFSGNSYAQNSTGLAEELKSGNFYFDNAEYPAAVSSFLSAYKNDTENANLNFKIGVAYILHNTSEDRLRAVSYLTYAANNSSRKYKYNNSSEKLAPVTAWLMLGEVYRLENRFDSAIICYDRYQKLAPKYDKAWIEVAQREKEACARALELVQYPKKMISYQLGVKNARTDWVQSCPVLSGDRKYFVFAQGMLNIFPPDICVMESTEESGTDEIFFSQRVNDVWSEPVSIMSELGIKKPAMPVGMNHDGTMLFLVMDNNDNGNLFVSYRQGEIWSKIKKMPVKINSKSWETHASMSMDGSTLYFTSERKGGYGGLDIYTSTLDEKGRWSKAVNLGPVINTPYDEETPFLLKNDSLLVFCSQGHYTMGGHDVFCSTLKNGSWDKPMNVGFPYNTSGNDLVYMVETEDGLVVAPMNRNDLHDNNNDMSLLYIGESPEYDFPSQYAVKMNLKAGENDVTGLVTVSDSLPGKPSKIIDLPVINSAIDLRIPGGEHWLTLKSDQFETHQDRLFLPLIFGKNEKELSLALVSTGALVSEHIDSSDINPDGISGKTFDFAIRDMLFEFDEATALNYAPMIDSLAKAMQTYSDITVSLTGFTDDFGSKTYNLQLSRKRAGFVKTELVKRGIDPNRILSTGKGGTEPVASNTTAESRKYNRRVEIMILPYSDNRVKVSRVEVYRNK